MGRDDRNVCTYFKIETDVDQNLINDIFLILTVWGPFYRKGVELKKYDGTGLISEETEVLQAELNESAEAATSSYSATDDFLQCIYSVFVVKNHLKFRSRCLLHEFFFTYIF